MFIALSVGCRECGEETGVLGAYRTLEELKREHPGARPSEPNKFGIVPQDIWLRVEVPWLTNSPS